MTKKALLIGIDYISVPKLTLNGCISDIINMKNMLIDAYDYDVKDIIMLRDDILDASTQPTKENILNHLSMMQIASVNLDELWIHYSGHGSRIPDSSQNNIMDGVIIPIDYKTNGLIVNSDLYSIIKDIKCRTILLFDCCHGATICELPWSMLYDTVTSTTSIIKNNDYIIENPNIFMFSGSKDDQTSADMFDVEDRGYEGAFTDAFMDCLRDSRHNISCITLYENICIHLSNGGFAQTPVFSSSSQNPVCVITHPAMHSLIPTGSSPTPSLQQLSSVSIKNRKTMIYS